MSDQPSATPPTPANPPAIEVRGFSYQAGGKTILREVSLRVEAGQYVSVIGPNGAGKTTLVKCIDRLLSGGTGEILVFGRALASYRQKELARRMGYVPQADERLFPFTVEQFVTMARYPYFSPFRSIAREDRQAVAEALRRTGTAEFADRQINTLSGGERQKVFLAAALAGEPDVLLLDEPTTFLDYRHREELRRLLSEANRQLGVTILAVTHDVNQAALESDAVVALREGRVVFDGPPQEVMRPEVLSGIYGSPFVLVDHPGAAVPMVVPHAHAEESP
jgi:iron complex transport system ATP-binding protein